MRINPEILDILGNCRIEGNVLFLPEGQLERSVYLAVNKCLDSIGGKWNRKSKGHVFDYDPTEELDSLLITGETEDMKKKFQFFPTPRPIAELMCNMAEIDSDSRVLEPSCGNCDLADVIWERQPEKLHGVELNRDMMKGFMQREYPVIFGIDFLDCKAKGAYNRIIMNPPFSRQQDIDHILHAFSILENDGVLVSVVSESPFFRSNKKSVEFRTFLDKVYAEIVELETGDFKESGTMVKTRIVKIVK